MNNKYYYQLGYGGIEAFLVAVVIGIVMYFYFYPSIFAKYESTESDENPFCRPYLNEDGSIKDDAPTIMAPAYEFDGNSVNPILTTQMVPYRLIKSTVPVGNGPLENYFSKSQLKESSRPNEVHCSPGFRSNGANHYHFCQWVHKAITVEPNMSKAPLYAVTYPANYTDAGANAAGSNGLSVPFGATDGSTGNQIRFSDHKLLFLVQLDKDLNYYNPYPGQDLENPVVDIYQQVRSDNPSEPIKRVPESVINCVDGDLAAVKFKLGDVIEKSPDKKQEQLGWFVPTLSVQPDGWYYPSCKPAVYLYPEKETRVNVKVDIPNGFLTYTDPLYPKGGWSVLASPDGSLRYINTTFSDSKGVVNYPTGMFPYLYYEGKVADAAVTKPEKGYVIAYDTLSSFYDELLPRLGLNQKEAKEFKDYWLKALPKASYYFIGIIPQEQLNENEPLTISPQEDTLIRVRLYFEALDTFKDVQPPTMQTPQRNGFTVVDWGGMVKADKEHPFTCLQ